jgi:hypothetical protein
VGQVPGVRLFSCSELKLGWSSLAWTARDATEPTEGWVEWVREGGLLGGLDGWSLISVLLIGGLVVSSANWTAIPTFLIILTISCAPQIVISSHLIPVLPSTDKMPNGIGITNYAIDLSNLVSLPDDPAALAELEHMVQHRQISLYLPFLVGMWLDAVFLGLIMILFCRWVVFVRPTDSKWTQALVWWLMVPTAVTSSFLVAQNYFLFVGGFGEYLRIFDVTCEWTAFYAFDDVRGRGHCTAELKSTSHQYIMLINSPSRYNSQLCRIPRPRRIVLCHPRLAPAQQTPLAAHRRCSLFVSMRVYFTAHAQ